MTPKAFLSTPSARRATLTGCTTKASILQFLSTPSARRATRAEHTKSLFEIISIHALREEGDIFPVYAATVFTGFLSTPSARRATREVLPRCRSSAISIHALREEGDHPARPAR